MAIGILLAQCAAMFVASVLVGSLPIMSRSAMTGRNLKAISVLGMGILVGAALTIIIPEGVSTLFESLPTERSSDGHDEAVVRAIGLSLLAGFALMLLIESLTPHPPHSPPSSPSSTPHSPNTPLIPSSRRTSTEGGRPAPSHLHSGTPIIPKRLHVHDGDVHGSKSSTGSVAGLNATLGMVIHGAADGIALGASSLSGKGNLGIIVFLAVLVHKGPTALGLTTTLLCLGLDTPAIRKRLLIFSCAAPLGAILTFMVVSLTGAQPTHGSMKDVDALQWWTGIALLFSGGSFLYVATVIQPLSTTSHEHHPHPNHAASEHVDSHDVPLGKYARTGLLMCGMVLPPILSAIVGDHGH